MLRGKSYLVNSQGVDNLLVDPADYINSFGGGLRSILKPFTTYTAATSVPHYTHPTGYSLQAQATAYGLNPFGTHTLNEGIVWGTGVPTGDINTFVNPSSVRTFGLKTPITLVGWGYDIFGYPSPNNNQLYGISGVHNTGVPSPYFYGASGVTATGVNHGSKVPPDYWQSGPLDVRWDQHRKVWTSNWGPWVGQITGVMVNGGGNASEPQFAEDVTYNVRIMSGGAEYVELTGVANFGPRPPSGTYKILPIPTGRSCFIVPDLSQASPRFIMWGIEIPAATGCTTTPAQEDVIVGGPSPAASGGTGFDSYAPLDILLGNNASILGKYSLVAGTGIRFVYDLDTNTSDFVINLDNSGIALLNGLGMNTNILQLSGLTTPIRVNQGGTGSSVKNFVDLSTDQVVASGLKQFNYGIKTKAGDYLSPGLSFVSGAMAGMYYKPTGMTVGIANSGTDLAWFRPTGIELRHSVVIRNTDYNQSWPALTIYTPTSPGLFSPAILTEWRRQDGSTLAYIGMSGYLYARYLRTSGTQNDDIPIIIHMPSGSNYDAFRINNYVNNPVFGINASGTRLYLGPSGIQTRLIHNTTGNYDIYLPSNSGTIALLTDIVGGAGISSLNGLTGATQTFATGRSGDDLNISSVGTVHTINIPTATAAANGLLNSGDFTTFYNRTQKLGFTLTAGATGYSCIHNLNTRDVLVQLYNNVNYDNVDAGINRSTSGVRIAFNIAPTQDIRCVVVG